MSQTNEMCCFCLNTTNVLIDLFSKSGDLTHFDKLSSTLSQLANVLNEFGQNEYMFCVKCCETIHMIYQFNRTCLNNVKTLFSSQKEIREAETEKSHVVTETNDIQHENRDESLTIEEIKTETSLDPLFNDDTTKDLNVSQDVLVKKEIDQSSNMMDFCQIDMTEDKQCTAEHRTNIYMEYEASEKNIEITEKSWYELQGSSELIFKNTHVSNSTDGYTCDLCNEIFTKKGELTKHRLIHGLKPYRCHICTKNFIRRDYLERHMLVHTNEKPYKCQFCLKTFKRPDHLDRHNFIHSGERPFSCKLCKRTFRDKSDLAKHKKIRIDKPFSCQVCCKSFSQEIFLNRHKMIHPPITQFLEKKGLCSQ